MIAILGENSFGLSIKGFSRNLKKNDQNEMIHF